MFDETSFSLDAFGQDAWLFLLDVPYFDLTGKQRIYVRSVVDSIYLAPEAEQIISFAGANNLSVIDAAIALRVSTVPLQTIIESTRKRIVEHKPRTVAREKSIRNAPSYVVSSEQSLVCTSEIQAVSVCATQEQITVMAAVNNLIVHHAKENNHGRKN